MNEIEILAAIYKIGVFSLLFVMCIFFYDIHKKINRIKEPHDIFGLPKSIHLGKKSEIILSELRVLIDADRITLLQFHNGQEFLPNNPVWKLTGTSSARADGVSDELINGLLIARVLPLIDPIITGVTDNEFSEIPDTCSRCPNNRQCEEKNRRIVGFDVNKMSGYSKYFLEKRGTNYCYLAALTSHDKKIFGVLLVEYYDPITGKEKTTRIIQTICTFTSKLCFLFN